MSKRADLRVGIISDLHVGFAGHLCPNYYGLSQKAGLQDLWVEYALRYYKKRGVDVIVVPGDIANACSYDDTTRTWGDYAKMEIARFGATFQKVFGGTDTKLMAIYGNHDHFCQPRERLNGGTETPWQDAFGEEYKHIFAKKIKGYHFVGANWGYEKDAKEALEYAVKDTPEKPVFYIQHDAIADTTVDGVGVQRETAKIGKELVKDHENIIALIGHTHYPITDERTIWQGQGCDEPKCTVVSCSTFNYADGGELIRGENLKTKHGLYLTVCGKEINIERHSFYTDEMVALVNGKKSKQNYKKCVLSAGKDWNFTLFGEKKYSISKRAEKAVAPKFPKDAFAGAQKNDTFVIIAFPSALPLDRDDDLLRFYSVDAIEDSTGEVVNTQRIVTESHIDHTDKHFSEYYQITVGNLKPDTDYTFKVYAEDCYGKRSAPIIRKVKTLASYSDKLR